jgi:nucleotide-binding universal stress UspA family protein
MDESDDAFRAAKRTVEIIENSISKENKSQNFQRKNNEKDNYVPKIIAFHSTEHKTLAEKVGPYLPSATMGARHTIQPIDYSKLREENILHGKKILKKTEKVFDEKDIDIETRLIEDKKPEEYIEKAVEKEDFELVVLGSKGEHSKLEQIFSGTVAQKVVNEVPCDILIVR